jgi:hypothetical protein
VTLPRNGEKTGSFRAVGKNKDPKRCPALGTAKASVRLKEAMDFYDVTAPIYPALEIIERYFRATRENPSKAQPRATGAAINRIFDHGRRPSKRFQL